MPARPRNPRPLGSKPSVGTPLDASSPLAQGLIGAWLCNEGGGVLVNTMDGRAAGSVAAWGLSDLGACPVYTASTSSDTGEDSGFVPGLSPFSVVARWSRTGTGTGVAVGKYLSGSSASNYWLGVSSGLATFSENEAGGANTTISEASASTNDGRWHLVCGTSDGTTATLYVDGRVAATGLARNVTGGGHVVIGDLGQTAGFPWAASIDLVLIYNRVLSLTEIGQLYQNPLRLYAGPRRGLLPFLPSVGLLPAADATHAALTQNAVYRM